MKKIVYIFSILVFLNILINCDQTNAQTQKHKRFALVIGIGKYKNFPERYLVDPSNSARMLAEILKVNGKYNNIQIMTDTMKSNDSNFPDHKNISKKYDSFLEQLDPDDFFLFYFSGHGISNQAGKSFLITYDTKRDDELQTSIPVDSLIDKLRERGIRKTVFIIEACREKISKESLNPMIKESFQNDLISATLFSTGNGNYSYEDENSDRGVFSFHLLEALKGKADNNQNGLITIPELLSYIEPNVSNWSLERSYRQRPYLHYNREVFSDYDYYPIVYNESPNDPINRPSYIPKYYNSIRDYKFSGSKWSNPSNEKASWNLANRVCKSLRMRLPTSSELKNFSKSHEDWAEKECSLPCFYWSYREFYDGEAEIVSLDKNFTKFAKKITQNQFLCIEER